MLNLNRHFKTSTALLVAGLTLTQVSLAPRQSHAILAIGSAGAAVPALVVMGASAAVFGGTQALQKHCGGALRAPTGKCSAALVSLSDISFIPMALSFSTFFAALVFLDESGAPTSDFRALTPDLAQEAGISAKGMRAFNRQLDRINSVSESNARGIAQDNISDEDSAVQYAHRGWIEAHERGVISNEAFIALGQLSDHVVQMSKAAQ
jgi:hypothetical protein